MKPAASVNEAMDRIGACLRAANAEYRQLIELLVKDGQYKVPLPPPVLDVGSLDAALGNVVTSAETKSDGEQLSELIAATHERTTAQYEAAMGEAQENLETFVATTSAGECPSFAIRTDVRLAEEEALDPKFQVNAVLTNDELLSEENITHAIEMADAVSTVAYNNGRVEQCSDLDPTMVVRNNYINAAPLTNTLGLEDHSYGPETLRAIGREAPIEPTAVLTEGDQLTVVSTGITVGDSPDYVGTPVTLNVELPTTPEEEEAFQRIVPVPGAEAVSSSTLVRWNDLLTVAFGSADLSLFERMCSQAITPQGVGKITAEPFEGTYVLKRYSEDIFKVGSMTIGYPHGIYLDSVSREDQIFINGMRYFATHYRGEIHVATKAQSMGDNAPTWKPLKEFPPEIVDMIFIDIYQTMKNLVREM